MADRLKAHLRAIDAATAGSFYRALERCRAAGATPRFGVEVVHGVDGEAPAEGGATARVCFRLEANAEGSTVADWSWLIDSSDWDGYRAAIELGVASMVGRVRRGLAEHKRDHDKFWHADRIESSDEGTTPSEEAVAPNRASSGSR